jgi:hypothetical protein
MSARPAQRPVLTTVITGGRVTGFLPDRGLAGTEAFTAGEMSLGMFMLAKDAHAAILAEMATS